MKLKEIRTKIGWGLFFLGGIPAAIILVLALIGLVIAILLAMAAVVVALLCLSPSLAVAPGHELKYSNHKMEVTKGPWLHFE